MCRHNIFAHSNVIHTLVNSSTYTHTHTSTYTLMYICSHNKATRLQCYLSPEIGVAAAAAGYTRMYMHTHNIQFFMYSGSDSDKTE